jgi:transcriptional regulator with XRE-family HTH domain
MEHIGKNILEHRKRLKLSRKALAEKAGVNIKTLEFIETGKTDNPSLDKVVAISEALETPLTEIVYGDKAKSLSFSDSELEKLKEAKASLVLLRDALDILLSKIDPSDTKA